MKHNKNNLKILYIYIIFTEIIVQKYRMKTCKMESCGMKRCRTKRKPKPKLIGVFIMFFHFSSSCQFNFTFLHFIFFISTFFFWVQNIIHHSTFTHLQLNSSTFLSFSSTHFLISTQFTHESSFTHVNNKNFKAITSTHML